MRSCMRRWKSSRVRPVPGRSGFVNAVLRQVTGHLVDRQGRLGQVDPRRVLPTDPEHGCIFDQAFLPDPKAEAVDYLSRCFSLPMGLVVAWIGQYGYEQAWQIGLASNRRPSLYLRPNPLKTTAAELLAILRRAGTEADSADGRMIRLSAARGGRADRRLRPGIVQCPGPDRRRSGRRPEARDGLADVGSVRGSGWEDDPVGRGHG